MQRLLAYADEVTAHPAVDDPLLSDDVEVPVHLEYPCPWRDHDSLLPRPVEVPVNEMLFEGVEGDVEDLQEVSPRCRGQSGLGKDLAWPLVIFENELKLNKFNKLIIYAIF